MSPQTMPKHLVFMLAKTSDGLKSNLFVQTLSINVDNTICTYQNIKEKEKNILIPTYITQCSDTIVITRSIIVKITITLPIAT